MEKQLQDLRAKIHSISLVEKEKKETRAFLTEKEKWLEEHRKEKQN